MKFKEGDIVQYSRENNSQLRHSLVGRMGKITGVYDNGRIPPQYRMIMLDDQNEKRRPYENSLKSCMNRNGANS